MRRFSAALVAAACLAGVPGPVARSAVAGASGPPLVDLLERYAKRDFDAVMALAGTGPSDTDQVLAEFEARGHDWTIARGPREAPFRRLIAASFALDLARVWSASAIDMRRWPASLALMVWGCGELRLNVAPLDGERWWHLAAVGLLEGRQDVAALIGSHVSGSRAATPVGIELSTGHLVHALAKFPNEPRLALALGVAKEMTTWRAGLAGLGGPRPKAGVLPPEITDEYLAELEAAMRSASPRRDPESMRTLQAASAEQARIDALRDSQRRFELLFDVEAIAGEAHLRYGYSALRLGDRAGGLKHLETARALTTDPVQLYLIHMFTGSAHERLSQPAEAIAAYRRALESAPGARSARLLLTSVLMQEARTHEADVVAGQLLAEVGAADPLTRYRSADYHRVFEYFERLRGTLQ